MTWVADDGYRISPGITGRVFEHFLTKVRERGGTGLELSTVRSQAEAAGGTLPLLPSERGRLFEIRLSLSMPPRPPA